MQQDYALWELLLDLVGAMWEAWKAYLSVMLEDYSFDEAELESAAAALLPFGAVYFAAKFQDAVEMSDSSLGIDGDSQEEALLWNFLYYLSVQKQAVPQLPETHPKLSDAAMRWFGSLEKKAFLEIGEARVLWIASLACTIYFEGYAQGKGLLPWSIFDFKDADLDMLLRFHIVDWSVKHGRTPRAEWKPDGTGTLGALTEVLAPHDDDTYNFQRDVGTWRDGHVVAFSNVSFPNGSVPLGWVSCHSSDSDLDAGSIGTLKQFWKYSSWNIPNDPWSQAEIDAIMSDDTKSDDKKASALADLECRRAFRSAFGGLEPDSSPPPWSKCSDMAEIQPLPPPWIPGAIPPTFDFPEDLHNTGPRPSACVPSLTIALRRLLADYQQAEQPQFGPFVCCQHIFQWNPIGDCFRIAGMFTNMSWSSLDDQLGELFKPADVDQGFNGFADDLEGQKAILLSWLRRRTVRGGPAERLVALANDDNDRFAQYLVDHPELRTWYIRGGETFKYNCPKLTLTSFLSFFNELGARTDDLKSYDETAGGEAIPHFEDGPTLTGIALHLFRSLNIPAGWFQWPAFPATGTGEYNNGGWRHVGLRSDERIIVMTEQACEHNIKPWRLWIPVSALTTSNYTNLWYANWVDGSVHSEPMRIVKLLAVLLYYPYLNLKEALGEYFDASWGSAVEVEDLEKFGQKIYSIFHHTQKERNFFFGPKTTTHIDTGASTFYNGLGPPFDASVWEWPYPGPNAIEPWNSVREALAKWYSKVDNYWTDATVLDLGEPPAPYEGELQEYLWCHF